MTLYQLGQSDFVKCSKILFEQLSNTLQILFPVYVSSNNNKLAINCVESLKPPECKHEGRVPGSDLMVECFDLSKYLL